MTQALAVRIAGPADAPVISLLLLAFNGEALSPQALAERMVEAEDLETIFLGALDDSLAGLLVLRTVPSLSDPEGWAEITELYVRPEARRQGVGTALVEAAMAYARERGCADLHLLVDPGNTAALAFYGALGFRRDSWEMRRPVDGAPLRT